MADNFKEVNNEATENTEEKEKTEVTAEEKKPGFLKKAGATVKKIGNSKPVKIVGAALLALGGLAAGILITESGARHDGNLSNLNSMKLLEDQMGSAIDVTDTMKVLDKDEAV